MIIFGATLGTLTVIAYVRYHELFSESEHLWMLIVALVVTIAITLGSVGYGIVALLVRANEPKSRCASRSFARKFTDFMHAL